MKKFLLFTVLILIASLFPRTSFGFSGSGDGSSNDPFQITTCNQLLEMDDALSSSYKQMNNIDCTGVTYTPVGTTSSYFTGTLDGQGYTISNITISSSSDAGLFGATSGATITNVHIESGSISGTGNGVGSLIGTNSAQSTITYSSSRASVTATTLYAGGLVGYSDTSMVIQKSWYNGTLTQNKTNASYMGGLIGLVNTGTSIISDSYTSGTFSSTNSPSTGSGGVIGITNNTTSIISRVYSSATITITDGFYAGGIIGVINSAGVTLNDSFSAATMLGTASEFGAIIGRDNTNTSGNNYVDVYLAGRSNCSGSGSATCTTVNAGNTNPNYFKGNSTNAPLNAWDFTTV